MGAPAFSMLLGGKFFCKDFEKKGFALFFYGGKLCIMVCDTLNKGMIGMFGKKKNGDMKARGTITEVDGVFGYYIDGEKQYDAGLVEVGENFYYVLPDGSLAVGMCHVEKHNGLLPEGEYEFSPEGKLPVKGSLPMSQQLYVLLHDMVYILAAVTIFFVFALRVVSVVGSSMYPTLVDADYVLLLSNVLYQDENIENGDIVVALAPEFSDEPIVKRVIATPGQVVDIDFHAGIVYVDGLPLEEDYINERTYRQFSDGTELPLTVSEGHVFVLGDNRNESSDSRRASIGQIDMDYILGKVVFIMLPGADEEQGGIREYDRVGFMQ